MKLIRISILSVLMLLLVAPACQQFDLNTDDLDLTLSIDIIKTNIAVSFINAATDKLIGEGSDVKIAASIHGRDADQIINSKGYFGTEYFTDEGSLVISLNPYGKAPSEENPVVINIVAELEGYLQTSQPVWISHEGDFDIEIRMVEIVNPCSGVEIDEILQAGDALNGILSEDLEVKSQTDEIIVKIKKGTELTDREGNPLSGELDVILGYFSPMDPESLAAFPGGFTVSADIGDGQIEEGSFVTAGFFAIEISDQNGNIAANFDYGALELELKVDPEVINYETGEPIKEGDFMPIWSYDVETGEWTFEDNIVAEASPLGLRINMSITHLSWYNIDWFVTGYCAWSKLLIFASDLPRGYDQRFGFRYSLYRRSGGNWVYWRGRTMAGFTSDGTAQTYYNYLGWRNVPPWEIKLHLEPYTSCGTPLFSAPPDKIFYFCDNQDEVIYITPGTFHTVLVEVFLNCTDTGLRAKPVQSFRARYRPVGDECWTYVWIYKGTIWLSGVWQNTTYEMQVYYEDSWQPETPYQKAIGTETNIVFEPEIDCGG